MIIFSVLDFLLDKVTLLSKTRKVSWKLETLKASHLIASY
jgi:hypothetical protein